MLTISAPKPGLVRFSHDGEKHAQKFDRTSFILSMKMDSKFSHNRKIEELSVELPTPPTPLESSRDRALRFNRGQPDDRNLHPDDMFEFGGYTARQAMCDEEYWTAAFLRAETHWEEQKHDRYVESHIRKFTEQEFNEIKRRSNTQYGEKCRCIVTVKKKDSEDMKRPLLKSMVGTLDLKTRYMMDGETFPGEQVKPSLFRSFSRTRSNRYGYISNVCVIKPARRQGVGENMMRFAIKQAKLEDLRQIYVYVDRKNKAAQDLYKKMGFQMIEKAGNLQLEEDHLYLLHLKI